MNVHVVGENEQLDQIKARIISFLENAKILPKTYEKDVEGIPTELIRISPLLWDMSKCNTKNQPLSIWFNKVIAYYLELSLACLKHNSADSSIMLFKSLCLTTSPIHSLTYRINLLKMIFVMWSDISLSKKAFTDISTKYTNEELVNITCECIKSVIFLLNLYDRPVESLCNLEFIIDWVEKLSSTNVNHSALAHIYYRIIYLLINKKSQSRLAQNLILRYLNYLMKVQSNTPEASSIFKTIKETLNIFISNSINTFDLNFLFTIRSHRLFQLPNNPINDNFGYKLMCMIFEGSLKTILDNVDKIPLQLPQVNMKTMIKIIRANILVKHNQSIVSITDGGKSNVTGPQTIPFEKLSEILLIPCSVDKKDSQDKIIRELILYLIKSCGMGVFTINSVDKTLVIRGTELLSKKYSVPSIPDISILDRKLVQLTKYVEKMVPEIAN